MVMNKQRVFSATDADMAYVVIFPLPYSKKITVSSLYFESCNRKSTVFLLIDSSFFLYLFVLF